MSKQTSKYKLNYFETGDYTSAIAEMQRWETVDAQLYSIFSLMGNGVISGWNLEESEGLSISITPGSGHVAFVAVESTEIVTISNLTPVKRNYIYVQLTTDSYWTKNSEFSSYVSLSNNENALLIGYVDTDETSVISINTDDKKELGYIALVKSYIKSHRHIGGTENPDKINLASEVEGIINQENLPDLNASIITEGALKESLIPELSHKDNLTDNGALSHSQIDSLLESLTNGKEGLLGEVAIANLLQLVMALKHIYPNIDDYLINNVTIIPGITPDDYIDLVNSTATIDLRTYAEGGEHTITGPASLSLELRAKIWNEAQDYDGSAYEETILDGNAITLDTHFNSLILDNLSEIKDWNISTKDSSSLNASINLDESNYVSLNKSAKVLINGEEAELVLLVTKNLAVQDWSEYKYLKFFIKTENINHGDLYFYIKDTIAGIQNSYFKVLEKNKPSINSETLENGWEEITIDISNFTKTAIDSMGFLLSTQDGWDTSKEFSFNIDDFSLTSGNIFSENGSIRLKFENNIPSKFSDVKWSAVLPSETSIKYRARFANTESALSDAIWTDYFSTSGESMGLSSDQLFKNIEIELYLTASTNLLFAPYITKVTLDFYITDEENSIDITTQEDWEKGEGFNLDTISSPGDLKVNDLSSIGKTFYGSDGSISQLNSSFIEDWKLTSTSLPVTTHQSLNSLSPSLGLITAVDKGENGNLWISDIDNDRILEIDQSGRLVRGLYGSFLKEPEDKYGEEESGPGSNIYPSQTYNTEFDTTSTTTLAPDYSLEILHSLYNPENGTLYIIFNKNIENIYSSNSLFDLNKFYVKVGTQLFYLYNSTYEIVDVPETQYDNWIEFYKSAESVRKTYAKHMRQFKFSNHVIKLSLSDSEKISLNKLVREESPFITISNLCNNKRIVNPPTLNFITRNFEIGSSLSEAYIEVILDGTITYNIFENTLNLPNLSIGKHEISVQLIDSDGNDIADVGASFVTSFVVTNLTTSPLLEVTSPKPNQIFSSNIIGIDFNAENFPILEQGQHIKYKINGEIAGDHYSTETLTISDLDYGLNTLTFYLVDENGNDVSYAYGEVTVDVIIGANQQALTNLYFKKNGIQSFDKLSNLAAGKINVDIANVNFINLFAPIDLQIVKDSPSLNSSKFPTILIAKLRSPSGLAGLSGETYSTEIKNRIINDLATSESAKVALNSDLSEIETENLIFNDIFLSGHSVVEYDMDGNFISSNNSAKFSNVKSNAKDWLGSVKKISANELLISDAINKRAIITYTDFVNKTTKLLWEYMSDRYISDAVIANQNAITITIYDGSIDLSKLSITPGTNITWKNMSSGPITIYSGKTNETQFNEDPDLENYGDEFVSELLNNGETYSFRFDTEGSYDWFSYSSILTGNIVVDKQRLSPNDQFYIIENDGLDSPFTSRIVKVDAWGNTLWSFGEGYIVKPRDVRVMSDGKLLIST